MAVILPANHRENTRSKPFSIKRLVVEFLFLFSDWTRAEKIVSDQVGQLLCNEQHMGARGKSLQLSREVDGIHPTSSDIRTEKIEPKAQSHSDRGGRFSRQSPTTKQSLSQARCDALLCRQQNQNCNEFKSACCFRFRFCHFKRRAHHRLEASPSYPPPIVTLHRHDCQTVARIL